MEQATTDESAFAIIWTLLLSYTHVVYIKSELALYVVKGLVAMQNSTDRVDRDEVEITPSSW